MKKKIYCFFWAADLSKINKYCLSSSCLYLLKRPHQLPAMPQLICFYKSCVFLFYYAIYLASIFMKFTSKKEVYSQDNSVSYMILVGLCFGVKEERTSVAPVIYNSREQKGSYQAKEERRHLLSTSVSSIILDTLI